MQTRVTDWRGCRQRQHARLIGRAMTRIVTTHYRYKRPPQNKQAVPFKMPTVVWWPDGRAGVASPEAGADPMLGLYKGVDAEDSEPHVVYDICGLAVSAMRTAWRAARDKQGAHYQLYRKNCSDLVLPHPCGRGVPSGLSTLKAALFLRDQRRSDHSAVMAKPAQQPMKAIASATATEIVDLCTSSPT